MRIDCFALGITAGLTCVSCNGAMSGLSQAAPALLLGSGQTATRSGGGENSFASRSPEKCHPIESVVTSGGETVPSYGRACEQPDGSWVVIASSDPTRIVDAIDGNTAPRRSTYLLGSGSRSGLYDDPWCTVGHSNFMGPYGGIGYGGGFVFRHHHRGGRR
jgi:hypothetical protein